MYRPTALLLLLTLSLFCAHKEPMPAGWIPIGPGQYWPALSEAGRELERAYRSTKQGDTGQAAAAVRVAAGRLADRSAELEGPARGEFTPLLADLERLAGDLESGEAGVLRLTRTARTALRREAAYFPPGPGPGATELPALTARVLEHFAAARSLASTNSLPAAGRQLQMATGLLALIAAPATADARPRLDLVLRQLTLAAATVLEEGWIAKGELKRVCRRAHIAFARFHREAANGSDPDAARAHGLAALAHLEATRELLAPERAAALQEGLRSVRSAADRGPAGAAEARDLLDALLIELEAEF